VEDESVAERERLTGGEAMVARSRWSPGEVVQAEGIGREEPVVAGMPVPQASSFFGPAEFTIVPAAPRDPFWSRGCNSGRTRIAIVPSFVSPKVKGP
jgi:hypothetical protein